MFRRSFAALVVATLSAGGAALGAASSPATATFSAASPMSWDLAHDMAADPIGNPIPDSYGNADVWSYYAGSGTDPSAYQPLDSVTYGQCGDATPAVHKLSGSRLLQVLYRSDATVPCPGSTTYPPGAVQVHPSFDGTAAIIGWTSPVEGTVYYSGRVRDDDPGGGDGVTYELLTNGSALASGVMQNGGSEPFSSAVGVPVSVGQTIYLLVGQNGDSNYDSTHVDLTFNDTAPPTPPSLISSAPRKVLQGGTRVATLHGHGFDASTQVSLDDASGITLGTPTVVDAQTLKVQVAVAADAAETTRHWYVSDGSSAATTCAKCGLQVVLTPRVSSVSPSSVAVGGSYDLMLTGSSFRSDMVARFSGTGVAVTGVSVSDSSHATVSITVDSAAKKGLRNLLLRIPGKGKSVTNRALRLT